MKKAICTFIVNDEVLDEDTLRRFIEYYHTSPPNPPRRGVNRKFTVEVPIENNEDFSSDSFMKNIEKLCDPIFKNRGYMLTAVQLKEFDGDNEV